MLANIKSGDLVAWRDEPGDILRFGEVLEEDTVSGKVTVLLYELRSGNSLGATREKTLVGISKLKRCY
jgi:hypothetical protein